MPKIKELHTFHTHAQVCSRARTHINLRVGELARLRGEAIVTDLEIGKCIILHQVRNQTGQGREAIRKRKNERKGGKYTNTYNLTLLRNSSE